ncbi:polyhydroxyalkanoate depolymerase [Novosphingobium cyanobacteriorum]|uniref:Polyhydroxyalkanoate depolymerase n=1 Tax=Novosphingobium cyanobacteriorum TaxID=3024215 RepID=A0ABT6CGU2_9SPHN|nr:polyhydroxyalkanoate depolymerase [Novosphingobium cyanobacteriorum]MDF8333141.1 polyhydroxyalkanoate depolymerase [Novosphingobium cyanobacteriorum]
MLYKIHEIQRSFLNAGSAMASLTSELFSDPRYPLANTGFSQMMASALDVFAHAAAPRAKPAFGIKTVTVDGHAHAVSETTAVTRPFGDLKKFTHTGLPEDAPRLLIVAPMSGHYATLLRGTVERMLERCVVYITDWADAKYVPLEEGSFNLDDYIDYIVGFLEYIGPGAHAMAVCQPSVPTFAATAVMAKAGHPCRPVTLTMMGGPIDTRESPTAVNDHAITKPYVWFKHNVITTVPQNYPGAGRQVYPGFVQLASFMSMNLGSHMMSHYGLFKHMVQGDGESADATKKFYDEYRAVCDMTAEFYLQTVDVVFQTHALPKGELVHRGTAVDLGDITDTAILCIEGERDDISGIGQTKAALKVTPNLPEKLKKYHLAPEVGHYGIFNGTRWRTSIAPVVDEWVLRHDRLAKKRKNLSVVA